MKLFVRRGILIMDDEFLKQRARLIRELADKADPFIKRRLMDLARNYDARIARPSRATTTLLSNGPKSNKAAAADADAFRAAAPGKHPAMQRVMEAFG